MAHLTPKPVYRPPAHIWLLAALAWVPVIAVVGLFVALCR